MLGFGHSPDQVLEALNEDVVMANIMTPALGQKRFIEAIRKEIGHNRPDGCPYASFLLMNSGSEGNSVADRLMDIHTGVVQRNNRSSRLAAGKDGDRKVSIGCIGRRSMGGRIGRRCGRTPVRVDAGGAPSCASMRAAFHRGRVGRRGRRSIGACVP